MKEDSEEDRSSMMTLALVGCMKSISPLTLATGNYTPLQPAYLCQGENPGLQQLKQDPLKQANSDHGQTSMRQSTAFHVTTVSHLFVGDRLSQSNTGEIVGMERKGVYSGVHH